MGSVEALSSRADSAGVMIGRIRELYEILFPRRSWRIAFAVLALTQTVGALALLRRGKGDVFDLQ